MTANHKVVKFATYDTEFPRIPYTGSPVSEKTSSRQLGEQRVGGNEKSRGYYIPTLHYARCLSAVFALWRTAHYHSNLLVSSFYAALSPTLRAFISATTS